MERSRAQVTVHPQKMVRLELLLWLAVASALSACAIDDRDPGSIPVDGGLRTISNRDAGPDRAARDVPHAAPGPAPDAGGGNECSAGMLLCHDTCIDPTHDSLNCGGCGKACEALCLDGLCCPVGQTNCNGSCIDVRTDQDNCGACGVACTVQCLFNATGSRCLGIVEIAAGANHSCARLDDQSIRCWGDNSFGQLNGTTTPTLSAQPLALATGAKHVAAGSSFTCVATTNGTSCTGDNQSQQLGDGTPANPLALTAGFDHACALANGVVSCWGDNANGQLGNGLATSTPTSTPSMAMLSEYIVGIAAGVGGAHTCAVSSVGNVWCFGYDGAGQLGVPLMTNAIQTTTPCTGVGAVPCLSTPVKVDGLPFATAVTAGISHSCALLNDRTVACWGSNGNGQLGLDASVLYSSTPVIVPNLAEVSAIASGRLHTCAILRDSTVRCWGLNSSGQLGTGTTPEDGAVEFRGPSPVVGMTNVSGISAGAEHTCALSGEKVYCWGSNALGQLGIGTVTSSSTPVPVAW